MELFLQIGLEELGLELRTFFVILCMVRNGFRYAICSVITKKGNLFSDTMALSDAAKKLKTAKPSKT